PSRPSRSPTFGSDRSRSPPFPLRPSRYLYWWHPLISGDPNAVHEAGVSVRGRVWGTEDECEVADLEDHIVKWPSIIPKRARLKKRPLPKA
ncbi:MAG: hypothetical protein NTV91_02590, partial [Proteobacteria bacterium]|nr:hypothetical protein [Pseudomonadota bacterium]